VGSRRRARELALQLLYQYELTHAEPERMQADFDEWRGSTDGVREFADGLLRGTLDHLAQIDEELERQTAHWRLDRLAAVDRNILRLAMYELLFQSETPPAVVIDEAIEIAKKFGAEESPRFINGCLTGS
jgi:N utilization substance protein B